MQSLHSPADIEAAYRFTRNQSVSPQVIADAGFSATVAQAKNYDCLLALEDTTTLSFSHATVVDELRYTTSSQKSRGIHAHSVLLFAPHKQHVVGLIEQHRWTRDGQDYGKSRQRDTRPYEEKESYKWEQASRAMASRLGEQMPKIISVCDREPFEYTSFVIWG